MPKTGVMVCGHGSRDADAVREFLALSEGLKPRLPGYDLEIGFLEFARPVIREGLEALVRRGNRRILAVPGMLFAAGHVKNDVPSEINEFAHAHPGIDIRLGRDLGIDARLLQAARERIESVLGEEVPRADTLLMVVGRGTNDPDANSNISKVARMLWEGMGFGWAETCYSGVAHPRVDAGLGARRPAGLPADRRLSLFPVYRRAGAPNLRADRQGCSRPSGNILHQGTLSERPSPRSGRFRRAGPGNADGRQPDELRALQIPGADRRAGA